VLIEERAQGHTGIHARDANAEASSIPGPGSELLL
jgi:hypothetical protein